MANAGRPSISKRQKERARAEKRQVKAERRATRKAEQKDRPAGETETDIDPDIAGIVPGPQPINND